MIIFSIFVSNVRDIMISHYYKQNTVNLTKKHEVLRKRRAMN